MSNHSEAFWKEDVFRRVTSITACQRWHTESSVDVGTYRGDLARTAFVWKYNVQVISEAMTFLKNTFCCYIDMYLCGRLSLEQISLPLVDFCIVDAYFMYSWGHNVLHVRIALFYRRLDRLR